MVLSHVLNGTGFQNCCVLPAANSTHMNSAPGSSRAAAGSVKNVKRAFSTYRADRRPLVPAECPGRLACPVFVIEP